MDHRRQARWLLCAAVLGCFCVLWMRHASRAMPVASLRAPRPALPHAAASGHVARQAVRPQRGDATADEGDEEAPDPCMRDYRDALHRLLPVLADRGDARSQLARALLAPYLDGADDVSVYTAQAYAQARGLDPEDRLVAWSDAAHCRQATGCDRDAAVARLLRVDPGNAAAWLLAMEDARRRGDSAAGEALLAQAAQADRYDDHFGDTALLLTGVLQELPPSPRCTALDAASARDRAPAQAPTGADQLVAHAVAIAAVSATSTLGAMGQACGVNAGAPTGTRRQDCEAVLRRMADGETLAARHLALPRLVQYTAGHADGAQYRERLRNLYWLQEQAVKTPTAPAALIEGLATRGEVGALQARLAAAGRWPAPAGWLPAARCPRTLVTTGRRGRGC